MMEGRGREALRDKKGTQEKGAWGLECECESKDERMSMN